MRKLWTWLFGDGEPHTHDWSGLTSDGHVECVDCGALRVHHITHPYEGRHVEQAQKRPPSPYEPREP